MKEGELSLDEWLQIWVAEKVAREAGMTRFNWARESGGIKISMGRTNDNANALSS
jgi:hypothetical protein